MSNTNREKKRKRLFNTTKIQYELYLNMLENDYIFRSGIINPNVEENYIEKKWEELSISLNPLGDGPNLNKEEWRKRFKDWKNATRAKFRKLKEGLTATGGGEEVKIKITDLEERALQLWGKVAVTGSQAVPMSGGLQNLMINVEESPNVEIVPPSDLIENAASNVIQISEDNLNNISEIITTENITVSTPKLPKNSNIPKRRKKETNLKPLNEIASNLSKQYFDYNTELNNTLRQLITTYQNIEERKLKIEEEKLKFAIAKYKHENKNFAYD